ncbi:MAG: RidA family protein [Candidatus Limiplasma sp.]|nr:RidA family protein [Clostridiales bacterium]MDY3815644.1 RidA family protein [Candidatus Limiplasma sp.]
MKDVYERMKELGYELPELPPAGGVYKPVKQVGNMLYVSGQGATVKGVPAVVGKVGGECTLEQGQEAARLCCLNALSTLNHYLGDLNKIKSVVKVLGFIASAPGFNMQPKVLDGCSLMLKDIWGEDGVGARSAIGVSELPGNIACEVEFIFEI